VKSVLPGKGRKYTGNGDGDQDRREKWEKIGRRGTRGKGLIAEQGTSRREEVMEKEWKKVVAYRRNVRKRHRRNRDSVGVKELVINSKSGMRRGKESKVRTCCPGINRDSETSVYSGICR